MTPSEGCVQLSSSFVYPSSLSTPSLPPSLSVSLFCCVCLQTTTSCCLMHDRLMPPAPCHMPLATWLTCLTCLMPAQRDVYHYYRDSRSALCQNPPRSRPRQLCVHLATPPFYRLTASCRPLGQCLRHTLATKLINLLQRHRLQSQFTFRSFFLIERELNFNFDKYAVSLVYNTNKYTK